jgi:predicted small secreted protein
MRRAFAIVLAAMLASSMAFAQSNTNSGAGVAGKPGSQVRSSNV